MKAQVRGEIGSRRAARENAVELGYEQHMRGLTVTELLADRVLPPDDLTIQILTDAEKHRARADRLIADASEHWDLHRMPVMDLTVLRLGAAELIEATTPPGVVIAETVYLTGLFSTEESSRFVNGILGAISRNLSAEAEASRSGVAD
jgi:N utilization substance protein B